MMGFTVEAASGPSIGFKPDHVVVNLNELLEESPGDRQKWLKERTGWEPAERAAEAVKAADSADAILSALNNRISPLYSDRERGALRIAVGDIYLQPTEERRRSGSHYTPRSLTEPIVRTTLDPVIAQLGENPTPEQILNLKVCDPAMGSGAFLVETCRYLGDALVKAWAAHRVTPDIPADQDPLLHARRVVAQRCLYGVDKNQFAVDLAKLSLWLATFAKDHPFTFLDHSFRHGDSLIGLGFDQIVDALGDGKTLFRPDAEARLARALAARRSILDAVESTPYDTLETKHELAVQSLGTVRDLGDAIIAAFFSEDKPKTRLRRRNELVNAFENSKFDVVVQAVHTLRTGKPGVTPFHWETEFPEVFERGGFDAIVGNPPFLGGTKISTTHGASYLSFLTTTYEGCGNRTDLVAYFFRAAFVKLSPSGAFGLIATNTIAQGDTRNGGLGWIRHNGGYIFNAARRVKWPGAAAVVVCRVCVSKVAPKISILDGREVPKITSYLFHAGHDDNPRTLAANSGICFEGYKPYHQGFLFDDDDPIASPLSIASALLGDPSNASVILPYLGGEDLNSDPTQQASRKAVFFAQMSEQEARCWPEVWDVIARRVKPDRAQGYDQPWWQYFRPRPELTHKAKHLSRVLALARVSPNLALGFVNARQVYSESLDVITLDQYAAFTVLQARVHETWARFFGSSMKDDLRYTPTDCFETFPFPLDWKENEALERLGEEYNQFRANLMIRKDEGLTKTYNRFHNKYEDDTEIQELRNLHAQMDRAVLDAYGWMDLLPTHEFLLDYEELEDEDGGRVRKRKEPWRYRWPDEFRDEVLARLLELNRQRAEEEQTATKGRAVEAAIAEFAGKGPKKKSRKKKDSQTIDMYAGETE